MKKSVSYIFCIMLVFLFALPVFAAGTEYRPSVENKEAPEVVKRRGKYEGETEEIDIVGVFQDKNGNNIGFVEPGGILVTPLAQAENAEFQEITDALITTDNRLKEFGITGAVRSQLTTIAKELEKGNSYEDFVVRDIFDVTLYGTYRDFLDNNGYIHYNNSTERTTLLIDIDPELNEDEMTPVIIYKPDGESNFKLLDPSKITRNEDGTLTLALERLGVMVLLTLPNQIIILNPIHTSPQTGFDESTLTMRTPIVCTILFISGAVCGGIFFLYSKKKKRF